MFHGYTGSPFVVDTNLDAAPWPVSVELTLGHLGEHFVHGVPSHVIVLVDIVDIDIA